MGITDWLRPRPGGVEGATQGLRQIEALDPFSEEYLKKLRESRFTYSRYPMEEENRSHVRNVKLSMGLPLSSVRKVCRALDSDGDDIGNWDGAFEIIDD